MPIEVDHTPLRAHLDVLLEADAIFRAKNPIRGDMWRQYPPSDKLRELRERVDRMQSALAILGRDDLKESAPSSYALAENAAIEDALDTINFAVFFIRQIREGARG
jgi:hypothetical protein